MNELNKQKIYSTDEVRVVWEAGKCKHAAICARGLPSVFKPKEKPWIQLEHAEAEEIRRVVRACPSGALRLDEE